MSDKTFSPVLRMLVLLCFGFTYAEMANAEPHFEMEPHLEVARDLVNAAIETEKGRHYSLRERPVVILEGDSWFDLPWFDYDIADALKQLGYEVMSVAARGDTLENVAFNGQLSEIATQFRILLSYSKGPEAIFLSTGGNDFLGPNLRFILNHRRSEARSVSGEERWMDEILNGALRRFEIYVVEYVAAIAMMCQKFYDLNGPFAVGMQVDCYDIPIIIHGYDYPVATGLGYKVLWLFTANGPWLKPSFVFKGYNELSPNSCSADRFQTDCILEELIDKYNVALRKSISRLRSASNKISNPICYLNLRNRVSGWDDEVHPDRSSMKTIAKEFVGEIERCRNR